MSTTDQQVLSECQAALVEPQDGGQVWTSGLWTHEEVVSLLSHRQNRLLKESLLLVKLANPSLTVNIGDHRIALPTDWVRTVSLVWRGNDGTVRELVPSDSFESDHAIPTWELTNAAYPLVYHEWDALNLQVEIAPAPTVAGTLELLYVPLGDTLTGNNVPLLVPDEFVPVLKYGTLADQLRKDGRGQDLARAAYCQTRFDLGVAAAELILAGWS
jgi:hypothetical protein